jgi:hypothetical protein
MDAAIASAAPSPSTSPAPSASAAAAPSAYSESDVSRIVRAGEHAQAAMRRLAWHDGAGCLAELDEHDKLDPRPSQASTNAEVAMYAMVRAECMMLAGRCDEGKAFYKRAFTAAQGANGTPEQSERMTDVVGGMFCHGANLSPRDRFLRARMDLTNGAWSRTLTPQACLDAYQTMMKLRTTVTPHDDDDSLVKDPVGFLYAAAPNCFARAGDCASAWRVFNELNAERFKGQAWTAKQDVVQKSFESLVPRCKGKAP